jgi:hypothetical protein
MKTICILTNGKLVILDKEQEGVGNDVERAFMVLQTRCDIVRHPVRTLGVDFMCEVTVCVIIHNMIFMSEHDDTVYDQDFIF